MRILMIDPPSGWKYGFPKPYTGVNYGFQTNNRIVEEWLLANGYPKKLIDDGMARHCRWWEQEDNNGS